MVAFSSWIRPNPIRTMRVGAGTRLLMHGGGFGGAVKKDSFKYTGKMRPGKQSPTRQVPEHIIRPDYAKDGRPKSRGPILPWQIEVKTEKDIAGMRVAGRIAREVLDIAGSMVEPGITTDAIDARVHEETIARSAYPSPLNYHGFPKSCCTSVNEVAPMPFEPKPLLRASAAKHAPFPCLAFLR